MRAQNVAVAGKTGTAQVIALGETRLKEEEMDFYQRDHAWFVAFAPADAPEIAVVVLNEHGGHGSTAAAPAAFRVMERYFELKAEEAAAKKSEEPAPPRPPPAAPPKTDEKNPAAVAHPREASLRRPGRAGEGTPWS